jgi:hypothetical protein
MEAVSIPPRNSQNTRNQMRSYRKQLHPTLLRRMDSLNWRTAWSCSAYDACWPHHALQNADEGQQNVTLRSGYFTCQDIDIILYTINMLIVCWELLAENKNSPLTSQALTLDSCLLSSCCNDCNAPWIASLRHYELYLGWGL